MGIIVALVILGFVVYLVTKYVPLPGIFHDVFIFVVVLVVILLLLSVLGITVPHGNIHL